MMIFRLTLLLSLMVSAAFAQTAPQAEPKGDSASAIPMVDSSVVKEPAGVAASNPTAEQKIIPWRLATVTSAVGLTYVAAYVFVFKQGWWDEQGNDFHFENDFYYARNLDKGGHFFSGILMGEVFYDGLRWSGVPDKQAYLIGGGFAFLSHVAIDIKDGYAPSWGFSVGDVLAGTIGGFWPYLKEHSSLGKYMDIKLSYWVNSQTYWNEGHTSGDGVPTDDYFNQTYWLVAKVDRMLPKAAADYWPDWLALAGGVSIDADGYPIGDTKGYKPGVYSTYEFFVGLDWDMEGLIKPKTLVGKRWTRYLNYIKFPMPAIQVYPEVEYHLVYPIKF